MLGHWMKLTLDNLEQRPWRKVVTLALRAGFLDLDRKGGLRTFHLNNDFGLETTLIWGSGPVNDRDGSPVRVARLSPPSLSLR